MYCTPVCSILFNMLYFWAFYISLVWPLYLHIVYFIVPSAPRNFQVTLIPESPTTLSVSWMIPDPANGIISNYTVRCHSPSGSFHHYSFDGSVTNTSLSNLTGNTEYSCSVLAATSVGEGNSSEYQTARTAQNRMQNFTVCYVG